MPSSARVVARYGSEMRLAAILAILVLRSTASAAPPEPIGAHPRMLLDDAVRAGWRAQANAERGPVPGAIALCESGQTQKHDHGVYQGSEWSRVLQACLVAWAATDKPEHAATAIKFFTALLDDRDRIGDGAGGDTAAQRDSGYAIRNFGPYTALAYDWLHTAPEMTAALKQRARQRWAAWLAWYREHGYRARVPGTNYQAGYLAAATMIAVAQAGESEDSQSRDTWRFVADELWGADMVKALGVGGILDGGDWPEGWQYGPLAVAHYALAARVIRRAGVDVQGVDRWLAAVLRRHVHGLSPGDRAYVAQDTEHEEPNVAPHVLTLAAVAIGDASDDDRRWAKGELARLRITDKDYFLYTALATLGDKAALPPRTEWPTWYEAPATGTVFARTRWDDQAVWLVAECQLGLDVDHRHPKAGNFVLSRGTDDLIVDPSPYGSRSSLTSNAPTVASAHLPPDYVPSQGTWGRGVGWAWAIQTRSGAVASRCDYAGTYKFQHRDSDVPAATRDLVLVPSDDGTEASVVVLDRARTGRDDRALHVRFRVSGGLALDREIATKQAGTSTMTIAPVERSGGRAEIGRPSAKRCVDKSTPKGRCDAARFDASDYRVVVPGPDPRAAHVITALGVARSPAITVPSEALAGPGHQGVRLHAPRPATIVWTTRASRTLTYDTAPGLQVVLDAPEVDGAATVRATKRGDGCTVEITGGGDVPARPAMFVLDRSCAVTVEARTGSAASAAGTRAPLPGRPRSQAPRSGCCAAQTAPNSSVVMALVVIAAVSSRRRSGSRRRRA